MTIFALLRDSSNLTKEVFTPSMNNRNNLTTTFFVLLFLNPSFKFKISNLCMTKNVMFSDLKKKNQITKY